MAIQILAIALLLAFPPVATWLPKQFHQRHVFEWQDIEAQEASDDYDFGDWYPDMWGYHPEWTGPYK
jgi:hypothetical protein